MHMSKKAWLKGPNSRNVCKCNFKIVNFEFLTMLYYPHLLLFVGENLCHFMSMDVTVTLLLRRRKLLTRFPWVIKSLGPRGSGRNGWSAMGEKLTINVQIIPHILTIGGAKQGKQNQ